MFNLFFLKIFFAKVPYVQQRSFYREFLWIIAVVFSVESLVQSNLLSIEPLIQSNFVWTLEINTDRITNQPTNRILNRLSRSPLHELFWYQCEKIVSVNHFQTASNSSLLLPYPVLILDWSVICSKTSRQRVVSSQLKIRCRSSKGNKNSETF